MVLVSTNSSGVPDHDMIPKSAIRNSGRSIDFYPADRRWTIGTNGWCASNKAANSSQGGARKKLWKSEQSIVKDKLE